MLCLQVTMIRYFIGIAFKYYLWLYFIYLSIEFLEDFASCLFLNLKILIGRQFWNAIKMLNVWSLPPACLGSVGTFVNFSDCFPITIISPCGALDHFSPLFVWKIILEAAIFIPDWYYDKLVLFPHIPYAHIK